MSAKILMASKVYLKFYYILEMEAQKRLPKKDCGLKGIALWNKYHKANETEKYRLLFKISDWNHDYFLRIKPKAKSSKFPVPVDMNAFCDALSFIGYKMPKGKRLKNWHVSNRVEYWGTLFLQEHYHDDPNYNYYLKLLLEGPTEQDALDSETGINSQKESSKNIENNRNDKKKGKFLGIVPSRIDYFIGRTGELGDLYDTISQTNNIVFLHGMPGIGKTSLAKVFIDDYQNRFDHIAWVGIDRAKDEFRDSGMIDNDFRLQEAFGPLYQYLTHNDRDNTLDIQKQFEHTIGLLNNMEGINLLIIDNYDETILRYRHKNKLPRTTNWKIIVTGRYKVANLKNIHLNSLPNPDAKKLFGKFCEKAVDDDLIEKFLKEVGYHTLMIEIAAKSLNESDTITLEYLYDKLKQGKMDDPELDQIIGTEYSPEEGRLIKHLLYLFDIKSLSSEEITILKTWYYLRPDSYTAHGISYFTSMPLNEKLESFLLSLSKKGWIAFNSINKNYSLHRVVQKTILYLLSPTVNEFHTVLSFYISVLDSDKVDINALFVFQSNSNYLFELVQDNEIIAPYLGSLLVSQAMAYLRIGLFNKAEDRLKKGIGVFDNLTVHNQVVFGPLKREMMVQLAAILVYSSNFEAAEKILLEALTLGQFKTEVNDTWQDALIEIYCLLIKTYSFLGNREKIKLYWKKLISSPGIYTKSSYKRSILEIELIVRQNSYDIEGAYPIAEQLFNEYSQEYANGQMSPSEFAKEQVNYGSLLQGFNRIDEALNCYCSAKHILEELAFENPIIHDMNLIYALQHIEKLLFSIGNFGEWKANYEVLWNVFKRNVYIQPDLWEDLINISLILADYSEKPIPIHIVEMVKTSLVFAFICSEEEKLKGYINEAASIFDWSDVDLRALAIEIETRIKDIEDESQNASK